MKTYLVGGAVRDALMGFAGSDRDWVVVGGTPEALVAQGYQPVGRDFPVFLHPVTHSEHALARRERRRAREAEQAVAAGAEFRDATGTSSMATTASAGSLD